MSEKESGVMSRLFKSLFQLLNISRKVIVNLVFFGVLFLFIVALSSDEDKITVPEHAALVLNLQGNVVEQKFEVDPMEEFLNEAMDQAPENPEVLLDDVVTVIEKAKNDPRIKAIVLNLKGMRRSGITKLRVIADALQVFKESGKQVIAIGDGYTQDQYYLASFADEIWLNPNGWLLLEGYGRYQMYYKSALEKLKVSKHIFRVGTYKSAVEPYMRDDMSAEAKEANKLWLSELWSQYKQDVAEQREFSTDNFDESLPVLIDKLEKADGKFAQYALANHWVDALKSREQVNKDLIDIVGDQTNNTFSHIGFKDYLKATKVPFPMVSNKDQVAVIVAKGTILDGTQKPGNIGGDSTAKLLRKARNNNKVKAVVLRVDSPGGSAYASDIIRQEIELIKQAGKTVVASMGTYAASGGYWISAPADKIVAAPTTITGSIGIYGFFMTFENSLSELGIYTDGVGTTELAGFGVTRPISDDIGRIFQLNIERGYQDFLELVAENRNMTVEEVDKVAQGRVWSGVQAKSLGLVDELGNLEDAVALAAELANLTDYQQTLIEKEKSPQDIFWQEFFGQAKTYFPEPQPAVNSQLQSLLSEVKKQWTMLSELNDPQGVYAKCVACEIN